MGAIHQSTLCHRVGLARPLSQLLESADALPCVTTALQKSPFASSPRDWPALAKQQRLKAFPVPGRLAGSQPIQFNGCSTSRHNTACAVPYYLWQQQTFTRLALQLILVKGFRLYSFQLPDLKRPSIVIYCHYLPVSGLGNLRACCLPWMW